MADHHVSRATTFWSVLAGAFCALLVAGVVLLFRDQTLAKDFLGGIFGIVTTPFFFEATVFFIGISLVVLWNAWRHRKEGDGWVYLAEADSSPDNQQQPGKHDAVFASQPEPEPAEEELAFIEIEGLLELGAWDDAGEKIVALSHDQRKSSRGRACRARLNAGLSHPPDAG